VELAGLIVTFGGVVVAGAAAASGWVQAKTAVAARADSQIALADARVARDEAQSARDEAARLAAEANDAFKRQAIALEEANAIARAKIPESGARWEISHVSNSRWVARNVGDKTAHTAILTEITDPPDFIKKDQVTRDVTPGDVIDLIVYGYSGSANPRVMITWFDETGKTNSKDLTIVR